MEEVEISACSANSTDNSTVRRTIPYEESKAQLVVLVASTDMLAASRPEGLVAVVSQITCSA